MNKEIKVAIDRDSVCAGDDCEPHTQSFSVSASTTISEFLQLLNEAHFLASIQGGKATWLIECLAPHENPDEKRCIGVAAQQWSTPRLIVPPDTLLVNLLSGPESLLYFRYWVQTDPAIVFQCVESGQALPCRYTGDV